MDRLQGREGLAFFAETLDVFGAFGERQHLAALNQLTDLFDDVRIGESRPNSNSRAPVMRSLSAESSICPVFACGLDYPS